MIKFHIVVFYFAKVNIIPQENGILSEFGTPNRDNY